MTTKKLLDTDKDIEFCFLCEKNITPKQNKIIAGVQTKDKIQLFVWMHTECFEKLRQ